MVLDELTSFFCECLGTRPLGAPVVCGLNKLHRQSITLLHDKVILFHFNPLGALGCVALSNLDKDSIGRRCVFCSTTAPLQWERNLGSPLSVL